MTLPADTTLALEERRLDSSAIPRSMPASFYADPAVYPVEVERVFINGWVCVGRADEIPRKVDYYTLEMFNEPLAVVRQADESVAVLSNVCRHRGSQILSGAGHTSRLVCPYHRWSYLADRML